jgi:hypothetical protein
MKLTTLTLALTLLSCGHKDDKGTDDTSSTPEEETDNENSEQNKEDDIASLYVLATDDLPECTEDTEGRLAYVKDDGFQACLEGAWESVEVKGEKGDTGEKGADGTSGGIDYVVNCTTDIVDIASASDQSEWPFRLSVTKYKDGAYSLSCSSRYSDNTFTYADTATGEYVYGPNSVGVTNGSLTCLTYGGTSYTFNIADNTATAERDTSVTMSCDVIDTFN